MDSRVSPASDRCFDTYQIFFHYHKRELAVHLVALAALVALLIAANWSGQVKLTVSLTVVGVHCLAGGVALIWKGCHGTPAAAGTKAPTSTASAEQAKGVVERARRELSPMPSIQDLRAFFSKICGKTCIVGRNIAGEVISQKTEGSLFETFGSALVERTGDNGSTETVSVTLLGVLIKVVNRGTNKIEYRHLLSNGQGFDIQWYNERGIQYTTRKFSALFSDRLHGDLLSDQDGRALFEIVAGEHPNWRVAD